MSTNCLERSERLRKRVLTKLRGVNSYSWTSFFQPFASVEVHDGTDSLFQLLASPEVFHWPNSLLEPHALLEVIGWPDFLKPFASLEVIDWPDSLFKPLASVELILRFFYFFLTQELSNKHHIFWLWRLSEFNPRDAKMSHFNQMAPLFGRNFLSLFLPFSRAQELSNESHIVWFRRLLKFNPPPGCSSVYFLPQVSLNLFLKCFFLYFSVFLSPWAFYWPSFRLSRAIFRILTTWRASAIFWWKISLINFSVSRA